MDRVWAEIDLDAIASNFRHAQVRVGQSVGILAVVKTNAYGHGAVEVAHEVAALGARALGVATPDEGIELRAAGVTLPIVVIGSCLESEVEASIEHGISLSLSPGELFWPIVEAARKLNKTATVHLLVDTGMSRDGLVPAEALELAQHVADTPQVHLEGTYTHLATAVDEDKSFCHEQLGRFNKLIRELRGRDINPGILHCANTSALFTLPSSHFDMVRQGLSLYGLAPSAHVASAADLVPAMTIKSRVMALRTIGPGESVGYQRRFVAERPTRLATIAMGYADGLRLTMTNKGSVLIHGRRAPQVGRVMMDCVVVDVTSLPSVRLGDEVVIVGRSGRNEITAAECAAVFNSSPYEVVCLIGQRVRRVYTRRGKRVILPARGAAGRDLFPGDKRLPAPSDLHTP